MKTTIEILVMRHKGEPIMVVPIVDHYTSVQLWVETNILDEDTTKILDETKYFNLSKDGSLYHLGESEARDFRDIDSKLTIKIENITIEVN